MSESDLFIGNSLIKKDQKKVTGGYCLINGEEFYKISHYDAMPPFFMTIVSATDHWLFISSNGALSAGRKNQDSALFPYYTDDKITDSSETTGSKSIFKVNKNGKIFLWEPFSERYSGIYSIKRTICKNRTGNKILFEEYNKDLEITFRYLWTFSEKFGFVKKSSIINKATTPIEIEILDGIQNILPYGVNSALQNSRSTLIDAYKKSELEIKSGMGIFTLSAMIVDKAEPSEALLATTAWAIGVEANLHILSSNQLALYRNGYEIIAEQDVRAERGAYFINCKISLPSLSTTDWYIISQVNQSLANIVQLQKVLNNESSLLNIIEEDIQSGTDNLSKLVSMADGMQVSNDKLSTGRHYSNVLFNIMRGGIFEDQYNIRQSDLSNYISSINKKVYSKQEDLIKNIPPSISYQALLNIAKQSADLDLQRICYEYLPLSFSRRHGDPSRPWNTFSIETHDEFGNRTKNYEGNWRDIFQNWEALAISYPEFVEGMISKFVNASTIDGYNPYRITRDGIDWEVIDADDPWSFIGYWGDHQTIYLLKLLELSNAHHPGRLKTLMLTPMHVYANVPYRIKSYNDIVNNPSDTIDFEHTVQQLINDRVNSIGADGKLVRNTSDGLIRANLTEKILVSVLTKLYNFIPQAGIWLNTQRPEWNDANNALVGNGASMVTLYYLTRFLKFNINLFSELGDENIELNKPVAELLANLYGSLSAKQLLLNNSISDFERKSIMDELGKAGENYRATAYAGFSSKKELLSASEIIKFFNVALAFLEHSIQSNKRSDGLYHAYNLIEIADNKTEVNPLSEMLEGQVAILSSQHLSAEESSAVLDALKRSKMFQPDQYSYMLYPDRNLPTFLEKNSLPDDFAKNSALIKTLVEKQNFSLVEKDINGKYHFNGSFHNNNDLKKSLHDLANQGFSDLVKNEYNSFLEVFETMFNHRSFTGRSGTFYGYEGLGSIYWHMVSKLLLATQENIYLARKENASAEVIGNLINHYYEIRAGIGINKIPDLYGAFPTDAYSHTPGNSGVQQPGMTGQVKEDIISRWAELGAVVKNGQLSFLPFFLRPEEYLSVEECLTYYDVFGIKKILPVPKGALAFTYCQIPIIYYHSNTNRTDIFMNDGSVKVLDGHTLSSSISAKIFQKTGKVESISCHHKHGS